MPSSARRSKDCCCESAKVKALRSLKMMGSFAYKLGFMYSHLADDRTICDHDTVLALNGFVGDCFREVDGEEDGVHLPPYRVEGSFEEHFSRTSAWKIRYIAHIQHPILTASIVKTLGESFWVPVPRQHRPNSFTMIGMRTTSA